MTSMRRLRRRELRWRRYAQKTYWSRRYTRPSWTGPDTELPPGHRRAWDAVQLEDERRRCRAYDPYPDGRCVCGGCIGMGPCDDDLGQADDYDDDICRCPGICECGWDEYDEDLDTDPPWLPPYRPVETITVAGGVL